jgi:hypothetical protein
LVRRMKSSPWQVGCHFNVNSGRTHIESAHNLEQNYTTLDINTPPPMCF